MNDGLKAGLAILAFAGAAKAEGANLTCTPALPVFCANVHVGCSGKTKLPTRGFRVEADRIAFDEGDEWRVVTAVTQSGVVYRRDASRDWIRIGPDRRFSQRVYLERGPVMAYGVCE